jgi:hypothetical protein
MAAYTLHLDAHARPGERTALERAVVLRDGFSWGALIFQPLWFLWHRLWLAALVVTIAIAALAATCSLLKVTSGATFMAQLALALFFAHEANAIRAFTLTRRARPAVDTVISDDRDSAEARLFGRWLARQPAPLGAGTVPAMRTAHAPVVGLFPEPEGGR